jgi:hypothetical protein
MWQSSCVHGWCLPDFQFGCPISHDLQLQQMNADVAVSMHTVSASTLEVQMNLAMQLGGQARSLCKSIHSRGTKSGQAWGSLTHDVVHLDKAVCCRFCEDAKRISYSGRGL